MPRALEESHAALVLTCKALRDYPSVLRINCEGLFTVYNLLCDHPTHQPHLLDVFVTEAILDLIMHRMIRFATTEYIIPALDVIFCCATDMRACRVIAANLNCLIAVKVPTIPITDHRFGTVSSFRPEVLYFYVISKEKSNS